MNVLNKHQLATINRFVKWLDKELDKASTAIPRTEKEEDYLEARMIVLQPLRHKAVTVLTSAETRDRNIHNLYERIAKERKNHDDEDS